MNEQSLDAGSKIDKALVLMKQRPISPLDSLRLIGLHSLSQTVTKLKKRGHNIVSIPVEGQRYVMYRCLDV